MQKILTIFANFIFILSLLFSGFLLLSKATAFPLPKVFLVSSGSMEPAIKTGSLVFTLPQKNYAVGDIVTFKSDPKGKTTTTHRVVGVGGGVIRTAGDANNAPDTKLTNPDQVVGKVYTIIPYLGYLAGFIQTPQGFILFVIVPATIFIYEEFKSLFFEIKNKLKKIKNPSLQLWRGVGVRWNFGKGLLVVVPLLFAGLIITTKSNSYFSDVETSSQNSFTAWIPTDTPTPTPHVIINEIFPSSDNKLEWIEIYNPSNSSVNISGYRLHDGTGEDPIPSSSPIPAFGFAVIKTNSNPSLSIPSSTTAITLNGANIGSGLNTDGDALYLKDSSNTITYDQMSYGSNHDVFTGLVAPTPGKSIARQPNGVDTDTSSDWQSNVNPSIGISNP